MTKANLLFAFVKYLFTAKNGLLDATIAILVSRFTINRISEIPITARGFGGDDFATGIAFIVNTAISFF